MCWGSPRCLLFPCRVGSRSPQEARWFSWSVVDTMLLGLGYCSVHDAVVITISVGSMLPRGRGGACVPGTPSWRLGPLTPGHLPCPPLSSLQPPALFVFWSSAPGELTSCCFRCAIRGLEFYTLSVLILVAVLPYS